MQRFKPLFLDKNYCDSFGNTQLCLRLGDLDEIGDSTHELMFHMLGMFSFRQLELKQVIDFWLSFMSDLDLTPQVVTVHPDKICEWKNFYPSSIEVRPDTECTWSDGVIGGYCTEFYRDGVEIGNIVSPLGNCIDVGFGLERLMYLKYPHLQGTLTKGEILSRCIKQLISEGFLIGHKTHGHILKKLLIELTYTDTKIDDPQYITVVKNQIGVWTKYHEFIGRSEFYRRKTPQWWLQSFGIDPKDSWKFEFLMKKHPEFSQ